MRDGVEGQAHQHLGHLEGRGEVGGGGGGTGGGREGDPESVAAVDEGKDLEGEDGGLDVDALSSLTK